MRTARTAVGGCDGRRFGTAEAVARTILVFDHESPGTEVRAQPIEREGISPRRRIVLARPAGSDRDHSEASLAERAPIIERGEPVKRLLDLVVGGVSLLAFLPVGLLIAVLVKVTSRGPVFFVQQRVGRHGRTFAMFKFRTMHDGTHAEVTACDHQRDHYHANGFKLPHDDPRITRLGRLLRATSLDESPQLLNVLRGDLSLVGIRPIEQAQLEKRSLVVQRAYRMMRPGMTGLWQTSGRSLSSAEERDRFDVEYVRRWSIWLDLWLLVKTPAAVLRFHETS